MGGVTTGMGMGMRHLPEPVLPLSASGTSDLPSHHRGGTQE